MPDPCTTTAASADLVPGPRAPSSTERVLRDALARIAEGAYTCSSCGVDYVEGYEGPCQEPRGQWLPAAGRWTAQCGGHVSAAGTASYALRKADADG